MYIQDGYLHPLLCAIMGGGMLPVWYLAAVRVKNSLERFSIIFTAMGAIFTFLMMMINIPVPGATSTHITGGILLAIVIGPWAALISSSIALLAQAALFGNGGIMAFGINVFNLAVIMPWSGYRVYRAACGKSSGGEPRQLCAAILAGCIGVFVVGLATSIEVGMSKLFAIMADSSAGLGSMMLIAHKQIVVSWLMEASFTALVLKFVIRNVAGKRP